MSEQEQTKLRQRGTLAGIVEKPGAGGWHQIQVNTGGQYPLKMDTKLPPLIELARAAGTNEMTWIYSEHDSGTPNPHKPGSNFINRRFEGVEPVTPETVGEASTETATVGPPASPAPPAAQFKTANEVMTKDEWRAKDDAANYRACLAIAVSALGPIGPDPTRSFEDLNVYAAQVTHLASGWFRQVSAKRDDPAGEGIPF